MKQKIFYFVFLILLSGMFNQTFAQTIAVESLSDFSTMNPPTSITIKLLEPLPLTSELTITSGAVMKGDLIDVTSPKRLKRDANFSFKPKTYIDDKGEHQITQDVTASYTEPIDKGNLAKNAALGVGSFFVKGLSIGYAAVEGAVKNEEDNRFKSSITSAYESSPFSYANKGEDLEIKKSQYFYLKFPNVKDDKKQNYTYTIEKE